MAKTTKLAGTFEARNIVVAVRASMLSDALRHCEGLGLRPRLNSHDSKLGEDMVINFTVAVPHGSDPDWEVFAAGLVLAGATIVTTKKITLICPPPETARVGEWGGHCSVCGSLHALIGPIDGGKFFKGEYILIQHTHNDRIMMMGNRPCGGAGLPPKGEIRRIHDGT